MNRKDILRWIDALIEGEISDAEFLLLESALQTDGELRREYLKRVQLSMLLEQESPIAEETLVSSAGQSQVDYRLWFGIVTAASFALIAMFATLFALPQRDDSTASRSDSTGRTATEKQAAGYGVISAQEGVTWSDGALPATGSLLPTGNLELTAGVLQLELFSGVSVVVEAPAKFCVTSPMNMEVELGKVRAHVPEPAHGFRLSTREGDVIDLGTDFAVDITPAAAEVHVLDGEVELASRRNVSRRLRKGQAVNMSVDGIADFSADTNRFVGQAEFTGRLLKARTSKRNDWLKWSERLAQDSRLVALYQFGIGDVPAGSSDRRIANRATAKLSASEGAVVAAARTRDRWQQRDGALDFSPTGSRIRLAIPGEFGSLTLMCWVRINSLDRWYNSLFLTDGHDQHEPHWQIMDDGRLFFSVKKRDQWDTSKGEKDKHIYYSPPFWDTSLSGQWLMIATVYDVDQRQVTHYLNGSVISNEQIPDEYLVESVRIGNASLCNWSSPERDEARFAVRNLNGSLDEFAMFRVALTPDEIEEMYEHGKP